MHEKSGNGAVEVFWDVKHTPPDLLEEGGDVLVIKRQCATEKGVEDNATAPDVHLRASVQPVRRQGQEKGVTPCPPLLSDGAGPTAQAGNPLPALQGPELQPTPGCSCGCPQPNLPKPKITQGRGEMTQQSWRGLPTLF